MFDNKNPYTLRYEVVGGLTRYFVSFVDGAGVERETEVSRPVFAEFRRYIKIERNLRRWDERHLEQSELTEVALYNRALFPDKTVEETVFDNLQVKQFRAVLQKLSKTQRRRFVLHYEFGLTFEQIAKMEGCKSQAVHKCVSRVEEKIKKIVNNS